MSQRLIRSQVLVSSTELSFNIVHDSKISAPIRLLCVAVSWHGDEVGFSAAVATNVIECIQNVFSKRTGAWLGNASALTL